MSKAWQSAHKPKTGFDVVEIPALHVTTHLSERAFQYKKVLFAELALRVGTPASPSVRYCVAPYCIAYRSTLQNAGIRLKLELGRPHVEIQRDPLPEVPDLIPKLYTLHPTPYSRLNTTPYTLHPTPYTLHPTPYTLHPTPYTLHPTPSNASTEIAVGAPGGQLANI